MLNMKSKIFKYIYAMLCLLPAIAVGITCAYAVNNQNAFESYAGKDTISYDVLENDNELVNGKIYNFNNLIGTYPSTSNTGLIGVSNLENVYTTNPAPLVYLNNENLGYIQFYYGTSLALYFYDTEGNTLGSNSVSSYNVTFDFTLTAFSPSLYNNYSFLRKFNNDSYKNLDNVFYYSLDKVENSSVFSWVKSNFLYEGVNQFVGIFGGTNSNISFYLTWVLTISLCYLGFEVLMLFINMARNLIHSFTDKDRW